MLNISASVVTGSNFSYVFRGIFSCFTICSVEITDGTFIASNESHSSSYKFQSLHEGLLFSRIRCVLTPEVGFGGLEDACWPLVPNFAGSYPAEAVEFFGAKKSPARPPEGK
jgi:hypothetical protein